METPSHTSSPGVLVAYSSGTLREDLEQVIRTSGGIPHSVSTLDKNDVLPLSTRCRILLIAFQSEPHANSPQLPLIKIARTSGCKILAHAEDFAKWSLQSQCLPLLAGASHLLDRAKPDFQAKLHALLTQLFGAHAEEKAERQRVLDTMKSLGVVGQSPAFLSVFATLLRISPLSDLPTLITGETGVGKEILARAVHQLDPKRTSGPFVALNCGALNPSVAESELFGFRRGAFTGADRDRKGLIRAADRGVLFLDEVGELSDALQTKLLRVLQEQRVLSLGEEREMPVNVRVIAATNRNLTEMVQQNKFRADLFYRLNILPLHVPPLRERHPDILPLIHFFLAKHRAVNCLGTVSVGPDYFEALKHVDLPGNVRQLERLVCHALLHKQDRAPLSLGDLPSEILAELAAKRPPLATTECFEPPSSESSPNWPALLDKNGGNLGLTLKCCERALLQEVLQRTRGNQSQAAHFLGITPRSVYSKMRKYHLQSRL